MPFTFSIVLSTQNSGAICTMPPIETTHQDADQQDERVLLEDFVFHGSPLVRRRDAQGGRSSDAGLIGDVDGFVAAHGAPDVVGHDQRRRSTNSRPPIARMT